MVLIKDHEALGPQGAVVSVKAGHARNDLYPNRHAVYATPDNLAKWAADKAGSSASGTAGSAVATGARTIAPVAAAEAPVSDSERAAAALSKVIGLLTSKPVVAKQRYRKVGEEEIMIGSVCAKRIRELVATQMRVDLPLPLIAMEAPISAFGDYRVPLDLDDAGGKQVELTLSVIKTRTMQN